MNYTDLEGKYALIENVRAFRNRPTLVKINRVETKVEYKKNWLTGKIISEKTVLVNVFFKQVGLEYGPNVSFEATPYLDWEEMVGRATLLIEQSAIILAKKSD